MHFRPAAPRPGRVRRPGARPSLRAIFLSTNFDPQDQKYEHSDHYNKLLLFLQYYDKLLLFLQFGKNSSSSSHTVTSKTYDKEGFNQGSGPSSVQTIFDSLSIYQLLAEV